MSRFDHLKRHATLVDDMASKLGVDLQERALDGSLSVDELSDAVLRCTQCSNPAHCEGWLSARDSVSETPDYCRNTELLKQLRP